MTQRTASIQRQTAETNISLELNLDGTGSSQIDTGVGFLDHMLTLLAKHGMFDLQVKCDGDPHHGAHHTPAENGPRLGLAFADTRRGQPGLNR